ncbi:hypothetical protein COEREDRAFT_97021 [Coemansia reversa NRRL 1564]|uniref:MMS19 nucleotide excision repair protein n=1 Tax=Coemansia reversa (strain ATCC 12441 / NRRL 1564) TaxID=763665 RepID=A0A2G5BDJ5_COERN|nr:hypothetical protein COEREDRAFT_97021 [Coemansia reversa NRRL 1564]|eukprot:PIA17081.1 hypothetical protein COEREDRAFT_97021 [Coemansia reversa NRRL 1564]
MLVQRLVDAYIIGLEDNADNSTLCQTLVTHISNGDISLLELVQALGSYLSSEEAGRRSKGAHVLADVLTDLPADSIPPQATEKLARFFAARLADSPCVPHALPSIIALQGLDSFTDQCAVDVLDALFKEVHVQSFQHSTRGEAYRLLDLIIDNRKTVVKSMGDDFVLGFAQMLDGEKDPRSLMVAFQIIPKLAQLVNIKNNAEDLFDVIFCYFPITFKHRESDPSSISSESLKSALRAAITCSPYFGDMAIKPLIEKTTAASMSVKIDTYETLSAAALVYDPEVLKPDMEALVEQIREDVIMASDEAVVSAALDTLEAMYSAVSPAAPPSNGLDSRVADFNETLTPLDYVLKDAIFQLTADDIKNPEQIGKLLRSAARSSAYNCNVVSDAVLPIIVERLHTTDVLTVRRELIDVLNHVLSASCDVNRKAECLDSDKNNLLNIYRLDASVPLDKEYSFLHITRLKGITLLILMPGFLDVNETTMALQTISRAAIERNEDENVNKEGSHLLVQLAQSKPEEVETAVLPLFFDALCEDMVSTHKVSSLLNALGAIGVATATVLQPILSGLVQVITSGKLLPSHCLTATTTIRKMVDTATAAPNGAEICPALTSNIAIPLSDWAFNTGSSNSSSICPAVIVEIAKTITAAFSKLDSDKQEQHLHAQFGRYTMMALKVGKADDAHFQLLPLYSAFVCACWPQTKLPVDNLDEYLGGLASAAISTESFYQRDVCFEIIATVLNKISSTDSRDQLTRSVLGNADGVDIGIAHVLLRHWVARALINRNDKGGYECVHWLLSLITQDSPFSSDAAEGFSIILGDHNWAVTAATHGVFRLLSKQRFYATVVPEITVSFKSASSDAIKANLLVVLTHTVRHMPKSVLMTGIEEVVPLLLSAIRLTTGDLKAASIRTITMVMLESPETLQEQIATSIIPLLIASVAHTSSANSIEVRRAAHDALLLVPEKYPFSALNAVRKNVLHALARARDDHKRLVRMEAVKAYNKWLDYGVS